MAKNKKRKRAHPAPKPITLKLSKTHQDAYYATARRVFQMIGEDASVLDAFTKRQKQNLFRLSMIPPRIAPMQGHRVPKQYIRYIQDDLIQFMLRTPFDEKDDLTLMEMFTVGQTMLLAFSADSFLAKLPAPQREVAERLRMRFDAHEVFQHIQLDMAAKVKTVLMMLSQPNFRIYGAVTDTRMAPNRVNFLQMIYITAHESQSIRFRYHNIERRAFRIASGQFAQTPYTGATIAISKIYPGIKHDRQLNIYIQSHAIHRFKERIDTLYPIMRNQFFIMSLMMEQQIVQSVDGLHLIACIMPSDNGEKTTIGYFTFTIDGNNLFVLTLLPLLSRNAPEGRTLYERLHLSAEDIKYLGMDRMSFFYDVDIRQIPALKRVLFDELHLDNIRNLYHSFRSKDAPFDEKKTLFVKNFFRKLEEHPSDHATVLGELATAEEKT
jgi:hypothetical protein